jgi:hypothetical protein
MAAPGDQQLRLLAIMALTLPLLDCTGDRIKQGMNSPQGRDRKSERSLHRTVGAGDRGASWDRFSG